VNILVIRLEEYDPLWLEVRRFLSIRSAKSPQAAKDGGFAVYLSDVTGADLPWIWSDDSVEPLFPFDERVGSLAVSRSGDIAFLWDTGGNERWVLDIYSMRNGSIRHVHGDGKSVVTNLGAWDKRGRRLCFTSTARNGVDFDLYVYDEGVGVRLVAELEGTNSCSSWVGEDRVLIVHMNTNLDSDIYLVSALSGEVRNLTKHYGEARNTNPRVLDDKKFFFLTNEGREYVNIALYDLERMEWKYVYGSDHDVEDLDLAPDRGSLVFVENYDGYSRAYVASTDFGRVELLTSTEGVIGTVSWGATGIFYDVSGPRVGHELFAVVKEEPARRITKSPAFGTKVEECVAPQVIRYESWDGMRIPALLYRPRVGRPPYPAVVVLHGGPEGQARPGFDPLTQVLVKLGYLVLAPNFRGSAGYGKTFLHLDDREKRLDSLKDIGALVDWVEKEGLVVKGRIAVTGASYGGYATLMSMVLFPDYWSCGVERVGIVNLVTFIKNTGPWRRKYRAYEYGDPETMADVMLQLSPISHIEKMKAPLMVVHGENDPRVPISEAEQLVEAMKKLGREVEFIRIGDEGHGVARVRNRVTVFTRIVRFIVKHTPVE